jgi:hypothetical protein
MNWEKINENLMKINEKLMKIFWVTPLNGSSFGLLKLVKLKISKYEHSMIFTQI